VINAFCDLEPGRDFFAASLHQTLQAVFPGVRMHKGGGQSYFVATDRPDPQFLRTPDLAIVHPNVRGDALSAYETLVSPSPEHGRVLTDDFNPVEFRDAHNREELRRLLALNAKRMQRTESHLGL
jgi:hypothetical protein